MYDDLPDDEAAAKHFKEFQDILIALKGNQEALLNMAELLGLEIGAILYHERMTLDEVRDLRNAGAQLVDTVQRILKRMQHR